jgi:membrane peptidoglycan carboxypeptidase
MIRALDNKTGKVKWSYDIRNDGEQSQFHGDPLVTDELVIIGTDGNIGHVYAFDPRSFPIPVMGKTGTTNNYRDALFVGSTFGPNGITVAVRIGFDDNCSLGTKETGALAALPVFREIILKIYQEKLVGPAPRFPVEMEENIDAYLRGEVQPNNARAVVNPLVMSRLAHEGTEDCSLKLVVLQANRCELQGSQRYTIYPTKNASGRLVFANE